MFPNILIQTPEFIDGHKLTKKQILVTKYKLLLSHHLIYLSLIFCCRSNLTQNIFKLPSSFVNLFVLLLSGNAKILNNSGSFSLLSAKSLMSLRRVIKNNYFQRHGATRIALIYFIVSFLWILFSDKLASQLFTAENIQQVQTFKGWFFISMSAIIIYLLVKSYMKENLAYQESLSQSRESYKILASNLAESENRLRKVLLEAPVPVILINNEKQIELLSNTFSNETGYTITDFPDIDSLEEKLILNNQKGFRELIRKTASTISQQLEEEIEIITSHGTKRIWNISASPLLFEDGSINITMMAMDITVIRTAEKRLSLTNRSLRVLSNCNQVIVRSKNFTNLLNEITKIMVQSGHYKYAWAGRWSKGQLIPVASHGAGSELAVLVNNFFTRKQAGKKVLSMLEKGQLYFCRDILHDPDCSSIMEKSTYSELNAFILLPIIINDSLWGVINLFETSGYAFSNEELALLKELNEDVTFAIQSLLILSEKKKIEEEKMALQHEQNKLLRQLQAQIDNMPMGLLLTDKEFKITFLNPEAEKIFGYSNAEALGHTPDELIIPENERPFTSEIRHRIMEGSTEKNIINNNRRKNGEIIVCEWLNTPITDEKGNFEIMLSMVQDITERLKFETHVRQIQRMDTLGTLAGGIAHDFNNILTTLNGYTEMALSPNIKESKREGYLKKTQESIQKAHDLVNQILTFSKGVEPQISAIDLPGIVNQVHQLLHHMLRSNIQTDIRFNSRAMVKGDETQLNQVIMNLCTNAIKAMREKGGKLSITTEDFLNKKHQTFDFSELLPGQYVKLTISDTGPGISPAIYNRIFEPFFTTYKVGDGTGLGLAVVYGILKKHNAVINVINKPREGARFEVYLPASTQ